jgi:acyl-coenzyme A thioesterase PaaI-like protein
VGSCRLAQLRRHLHPSWHAGIKIPVSAIMGVDIAGAIAATDREVLDRKLGARVLGDPINRVEDGLTGETVHGGPIAAIIDTIGDYVMLLARPQPTVNFRVDYLRPEVDTARIITSTVRRHSGRLIGVVGVDVANEVG